MCYNKEVTYLEQIILLEGYTKKYIYSWIFINIFMNKDKIIVEGYTWKK